MIFPEKFHFSHTISKTFSALQYRNYRLWFFGQLFSLVGTWMQGTALSFLVYELTHSPAYLGFVSLANGAPPILLMMLGGVIADRVSKRSQMLVSQLVLMCFALGLTYMTFQGVIEPWHVLVLSVFLGIANAFEAPARQALVYELVDRKDLSNAIALNSAMFNLAAVVGPSIAGIVYAAFGAKWCFLINSISYLSILIALTLMKVPNINKDKKHTDAFNELKEGLSYCLHHKQIRFLLLISIVVSVVGISYATLLPDIAMKVLHGNSETNGWLQSSRGLGALIGALVVATLGVIHDRSRFLLRGIFIFPITLLAFALSSKIYLSLILLTIVGLGVMIVFNSLNVFLHSIVLDEYRGRVMSIYTLTFFGGAPLGGMMIGAIAEVYGSQIAIIMMALLSILFAIYARWKYTEWRVEGT